MGLSRGVNPLNWCVSLAYSAPVVSKRLNWSFASNPLSILLDKKKREGVPVVDLTESNPTRSGLLYPEEEILQSLAAPEVLRYDPDPIGLLKAREAVADYHRERGLKIDPDELFLTASTSEAYSFLFRILADPGDTVLVPRPSYPLFEYLAAVDDLVVSPYTLTYEGRWQVDLSSLEAGIGPKTRALLVVNPNNPTGSFISPPERRQIQHLCQSHGICLIVDEVFIDYPLEAPAGDGKSFMEQSEVLTLVLGGLSKAAGLPQMKLAWTWTGGLLEQVRPVRERLEQMGDLFLSLNTPVQNAAGTLLSGAKRMQALIGKRLRANLTELTGLTERAPACDRLRVEGGWYAVLRVPAILTSEEWAWRLLSEKHVHIHPGYLFDFPSEAYLVLSLLTEENRFRLGMEGLGSLLEEVDDVRG